MIPVKWKKKIDKFRECLWIVTWTTEFERQNLWNRLFKIGNNKSTYLSTQSKCLFKK